MPTGDALKGLGTDHASIEPAFLVAQRVNDKVGIEAQFGGVIPTGGSPGPAAFGSGKFSGGVLYYGIGPSFDVYSSDRVRFAPVIELVGWRVTGGYQTATEPPFDASGVNIVNLKIGARVVMEDRNSLYIGYGHHLTDASWYESILRFEFRRLF